MTRRSFAGIAAAALLAHPSRSYKLQAIAAAHMPHTVTIHSSDPRFASHLASGGIVELRDYPTGRQMLLFDSLEARDRAWTLHNVERTAPPADSPTSIALYRPA